MIIIRELGMEVRQDVFMIGKNSVLLFIVIIVIINTIVVIIIY